MFFVKLFQEMTRFFPVETGIYLDRAVDPLLDRCSDIDTDMRNAVVR